MQQEKAKGPREGGAWEIGVSGAIRGYEINRGIPPLLRNGKGAREPASVSPVDNLWACG